MPEAPAANFPSRLQLCVLMSHSHTVRKFKWFFCNKSNKGSILIENEFDLISLLTQAHSLKVGTLLRRVGYGC